MPAAREIAAHSLENLPLVETDPSLEPPSWYSNTARGCLGTSLQKSSGM